MGMNTKPARPSTLQRAWARGYDWVFDRIDAQGSGEHRRRLAAPARGDVLEVGAGTGRSFCLYRHATHVVAAEPDPGMRSRAQQAARAAPVSVEVVAARAEQLPFADARFDTVLASCVLCTVADPDAALAEMARVLRPGGRLRFYEHVRAADPRQARWQDRLERPWGWVGRGCHPNRDTVAAIARAGLDVVELDGFDFDVMPALVRPHVLGVAERPRDTEGRDTRAVD